MKKVRKKITMLIATVAVVAVSISATLALLSGTTGEKVNTFTPSENIKVDIDEPNWEGDENGDGRVGKEDAEKYAPNMLIEKDPFLTNKTESEKHNDEYVSMELSYFIADKEVTYDEFSKIATVYHKTSEGKAKGFNPTWLALTSENSEHGQFDRFFYGTTNDSVFNLTVLPVNQKTTSLFDYVLINDTLSTTSEKTLTDINGTEFNVVGMPTFEIKIKGYAVQVDNITQEEAQTELLNLMKKN